MTEIKICGLSRPCDIIAVNELKPEYIGFVFYEKSKRFVSFEKARVLKKALNPEIKAVGVFVNEKPEVVLNLLNSDIIDIAQLHGNESEEYISCIKAQTTKPVIKAFSIVDESSIISANESKADYVLLDSGKGGTGTVFDWELLKKMKRKYFLAGGLSIENAQKAIEKLKPFAVDVSSGVETDGLKDKDKIAEFISAVRKENKYE